MSLFPCFHSFFIADSSSIDHIFKFFPVDVAKYTKHVKSARPVTPDGEVLVPGEPELRMRAERGKTGLPLPDDTWAAIVTAAKSVGLDDARVKAAMG